MLKHRTLQAQSYWRRNETMNTWRRSGVTRRYRVWLHVDDNSNPSFKYACLNTIYLGLFNLNRQTSNLSTQYLNQSIVLWGESQKTGGTTLVTGLVTPLSTTNLSRTAITRLPNLSVHVARNSRLGVIYVSWLIQGFEAGTSSIARHRPTSVIKTVDI